MTLNNNVGYYINHSSSRHEAGPLREPGLIAGLVYGKPIVDELVRFGGNIVRPVERAFELLRYSALDKQGKIYVAHFDPGQIVLGGNQNTVDVPSTPELHRVFDEYLPEWKREKEIYLEEYDVAFQRGMERAGLTWEQAEVLSAEDRANEERAGLKGGLIWAATMEQVEVMVAEYVANNPSRYNAEFYDVVVQHIDEIPKIPLVNVEGIDDILDSIDVMPLPER